MTRRTPGEDTARIAGLFAQRIAAAKAQLAEAMEARGLTEASGWRIHEDIVGSAEGPAMRLRPIHRVLESPQDLEIRVSLR